MNDALSQTLAKLDLQPGQCQVFQVNGYRVEIRRPTEDESDFSDMAMLEPWATFPQGEPAMQLAVRVEPHPLPVAPISKAQFEAGAFGVGIFCRPILSSVCRK